ncbi:type II secretion system F family protein [Streptomyces sp. CJ_13]|uniref:type II secretion system F family protein n=1 Tax=Streptomyces sp. CJ_13 TaxID=2724943 RepID=UPI001BDC192C|nr:type II secretion system F family protein [Streptomyces sp. CJ_13]MBT1184757.1 type II secretion system F family protein [Streptomyces sp. CJ_13]
MNISPYAVVGGAVTGLGLVIAVRGIVPGRPDLGDVLSRMDATRLENLERRDSQANTLMEKAGVFLLRTVGEGTLRLPRQQLELVGRSPAAHLGRKLALALYGLLLPVLVVTLANLAGYPFPVAIPAIAGIGLAVVFWLLPDLQLKQQATEAKGDFRYAVKTYLLLVQLEREANAAPTQALKQAADVGEGWVFAKIRDTITRAELEGISPWEGLKRLSIELDVPELGAPADIIAIAGEEGAAVGDTLGAQAKSLSGALVTSAKAQANMASEKMVMPVALLVLIMTVYIGYPAISRIMAS